MNIKKIGTFISLVVISLIILASCSGKKRLADGQNIVINEVMASNRTGLLNHKGNPGDWIEIKNTSKDSIDLEGFELALVKPQKPQAAKLKDDSEDNEEDNIKTWEFPSVRIGAGECMVVFAKKGKAKKDNKEEGDEEDSDNDKEYKAGDPLVANFNLPKEGATLQFRAPNGDVITEVNYGQLEPDQSLARKEDGKYEATYWQSPGFDNDREGYEKAALRMDDQRKDPLRIWEVMSRAPKKKDNWIELKNVGDKPINLASYKLSKKMGKGEGWTLPDKELGPGKIITLQLAGKNADEKSTTQAGLKVGDAETLVLTKNGNFVDGVCAKLTPYRGSIGRAEGKKGFFYYPSPTRNQENGKSGRRFIADNPVFDKAPGVYSKEKNLTLRLKPTDRKVHYTLDGSEPTPDSPLLKDSLVLTENKVIRTYAEGDSVSLQSPIATYTYLLDVEHDLPVINIAVNKNDLYDYNKGIYVEGPGYTKEWPHKGANYWKPWTKKAHVEFFDDKEDKKGFSVDCGLKIFGGFSRAEAKKSFTLKFKGEFGHQEVDYDFFDNGTPEAMEDLVLRSGSQDYNRCMIRDEFFTSLMKEQSPAILTQHYRPVALYINAEYFGLYYIREKIDKNFVGRKLNLPNDSINIVMSIGYTEEGPKGTYQDLMSFVRSHDMTVPENYEYMRKNVDFEGLIDYKLGEIYSDNSDVGNIRYVRSTHPKSDKKWHFVFYDLDASWAQKHTPDFYLGVGEAAAKSNVKDHNIMINKLLANKDFRALFLQRLSHHMKNTFTPDNTTKVFDNLVAKIRPEMKHNCKRWPKLSYEQWEKNIAQFREGFKDKNKTMLDGLRNWLSVTDEENKKYFAGL